MITWLLDLDNTLHDAGAAIMPRINSLMTQYVAQSLQVSQAQASDVRVQYWRRYGATLLGMIRHHAVDPHDFLAQTHDIADLAALVQRDHRLAQLLRRLPGRKWIVTNAPRAYARVVLRGLGIWPLLDGIVTIEDMAHAGRWQPKPSTPMMRRLIARLGVPAWRCIMVEDSIENLRSARRCGARTVWVSRLARRAQARSSVLSAQPSRRPHSAVDFHLQSVLTLTRIKLAPSVH